MYKTTYLIIVVFFFFVLHQMLLKDNDMAKTISFILPALSITTLANWTLSPNFPSHFQHIATLEQFPFFPKFDREVILTYLNAICRYIFWVVTACFFWPFLLAIFFANITDTHQSYTLFLDWIYGKSTLFNALMTNTHTLNTANWCRCLWKYRFQ